MRIQLTKALFPDPTWTCAAAASAAGSAVSAVGDVAAQLLGVPLPVVLAAVAGAFLARAYTPPTVIWKAAAASTAWTVAGCVLAPVAPPAISKYAGLELPPAGLAGVALCISLAGPLLLPLLVDKAKGYVKGKGGQSGDNP